MSVSNLPAIHPGEILRDLYLSPLQMTPYALAKKLRVPRTRIERLVAEKTGITADTALRLAKFFKTEPMLWMTMQTAYDIKVTQASAADEIASIAPLESADE